jgi:hypothetical protein
VSFEKMTQINKPLAQLRKRKFQINKIRNESRHRNVKYVSGRRSLGGGVREGKNAEG